MKNNMSKNIILFLLISILTKCDNKEHIIIDYAIINHLSKSIDTDSNYVDSSQYNILFVKVDSNKYLQTNGRELSEIYHRNHFDKYKDYEDFLYNILNQKDILTIEKTQSIPFELNRKIAEKSTKEIINQYAIKESNGKYILRSNYEDINSILYLFFINSYTISFDDYSGNFIITKNFTKE